MLFQQRLNGTSSESFYQITTQLESLRKIALTRVLENKEKYPDKTSKRAYLQEARNLPIFSNHLYSGKFSLIKNIGRTNSLIKIDVWLNAINSENIPDLNNIKYSKFMR